MFDKEIKEYVGGSKDRKRKRRGFGKRKIMKKEFKIEIKMLKEIRRWGRIERISLNKLGWRRIIERNLEKIEKLKKEIEENKIGREDRKKNLIRYGIGNGKNIRKGMVIESKGGMNGIEKEKNGLKEWWEEKKIDEDEIWKGRILMEMD